MIRRRLLQPLLKVKSFELDESTKMMIQQKRNANTLVFFGCFVFLFAFNIMTSIPGDGLNREAYESTPKRCKVNGGKAIAHDRDPLLQAHLTDQITYMKRLFDTYDMPEIAVVSPTFFFLATDPLVTEQNKSHPSRSRAWNETFAVTDHESITETGHDIFGSQGLEDPFIQGAMSGGGTSRLLEDGKYTAFSGWYVGNFGHFVHDFASKIAWLKTLVSEDTKFLLPYHPLYQDVLNEVDIDFVRDRIKWIKYGETVHVMNGSLTVMKPKSSEVFKSGYPQTATIFTEHFRRWLEESNWSEGSLQSQQPRNKVIFYSRKGGTPRRNVEYNLEQRLIKKTIEVMEKRGQSAEDLYIFNGKDEYGNTLNIPSQRLFFSMADTVIGPHGSGLTNIIWMDPRCDSGSPRPKVLEFASSRRSPAIQSGSYWGYWFLFGSMPWIDYHYIYYTAESTDEAVYVDEQVFEDTLHQMWGLR